MAHENKQSSFALRVALFQAKTNLENFRAALELVNFCESQQDDASNPCQRWLFIAYRDGALSIWNFLKALTLAKTIVSDDKLLRGAVGVDFAKIDGAISDFYTAFPSFKGVRDSISHQSELIKEIRNGTLNNFIMGNVDGRTFHTTGFGGKAVSYELSETSVAAMGQCYERLKSSFGEAV